MRGLVLCTIGLLTTVSLASGREWTDATGRHRVEARLLQCHDNTVWLEKPNSRLVLVPLQQLSTADRAYVQRECPGQASTRVRAAAAGAIAKTASPAYAPARLERDRRRATFRFASLSTRQPDETAEELGATEEPVTIDEPDSTEELPGPAATAPPSKFIYSGRCGTFHLIGDLGTGAYWYGGKHYLAMLFKAGEDANYLYYDSNHPDGQIIQWYFSKTQRCCKYWVWKRTDTGHGHYEREHREIPN